MKVILIIPAYNEEECIEPVVENLIQNYPEYDYVIINDGSVDKTSAICHEKGYEIIDLPVNLGLAGAFQTGLRYAYDMGYDYAIQFDADGQHKPEYIKDMLRTMEQGYDIVIGSRFVTEAKPATMRMLGNNLISWAIRLTTGAKINDPTSGMRMYSKDMMREFGLCLNYGPEPDTISFLIKQGVRVGECQVQMDERIGGSSYLTAVRSIQYMLRMMLSIIVVQNVRKRDKKFIIQREGK